MSKKEKNEEAVQTAESVDTTNTTETTMESAQLTIQDLTAISNIIDLASRRGAFQAREMATVGASFNKLTAFLDFIAAQQKASEEASEEASSDSE